MSFVARTYKAAEDRKQEELAEYSRKEIQRLADELSNNTGGSLQGWFNVKSYGAIGNGSTDDTAAINAAIAALTNNSVLFFPPGVYNTSGLSTLAGLTNVTLFGPGAVIYQTVQANNIWVIERTCTGIAVIGLTFGGAATSRLSGIHLRFRASHSVIQDCTFYGSSDFLLFIGDHNNATPTQYVSIIDCRFRDSKGDGIHLGNARYIFVDNCTAWNTGDDSFAAVGYESHTGKVKNITFRNCSVYNSGARGFAMLMVDDCLLENCYVDTCQLSAFEIGDHGIQVGVFNERVTIRNCGCINAVQLLGPYAAFNLYFVKDVQVQNVTVRKVALASGVSIFDFDNAQISDLDVQSGRAGFFRGVIIPDTTSVLGRNGRSAWGNLFISGYSFDLGYSDNNEALFLEPASGITVDNLMVLEAKGSQVSAGNYISYNRVATSAKIGNCCCLQSRSINWGGNGVAATTFNNN